MTARGEQVPAGVAGGEVVGGSRSRPVAGARRLRDCRPCRLEIGLGELGIENRSPVGSAGGSPPARRCRSGCTMPASSAPSAHVVSASIAMPPQAWSGKDGRARPGCARRAADRSDTTSHADDVVGRATCGSLTRSSCRAVLRVTPVPATRARPAGNTACHDLVIAATVPISIDRPAATVTRCACDHSQ